MKYNNGTSRKTIYWIRHGESLSNTSELNSQIIDPGLTANGISQCENLKRYIESMQIDNSIDLVITSSLTRALETCSNVFVNLIYRVKFICLDEIREQMDKPCHKRKILSKNKTKNNNNNNNKYKFIDFSNVPEHDIMYAKTNGSESKSEVTDRCEWFIKWIGKRSESNIVVITHGNFLFPMFNNVLTNVSNKTFFSNCELRILEL